MRSTVTTTAIPASIQPFIWFKNEKALNTFVFTSFANAMTDAPITPHAPEMTTLLFSTPDTSCSGICDNSLTVNQPQKDKVRANIFKNMLAMAGK